MGDTELIKYRYSLKSASHPPSERLHQNELSNATRSKSASTYVSERYSTNRPPTNRPSTHSSSCRDGRGSTTKVSVALPQMKNKMVYLYKQQSSINVKGRPCSAPENKTLRAEMISPNIPNDHASSEAERSDVFFPKLETKVDNIRPPSRKKIEKLVAIKNELNDLAKLQENIMKGGSRQNAENSTMKMEKLVSKNNHQDNIKIGLDRKQTPFWFYRSKTDVLLESVNDNAELDEMKGEKSDEMTLKKDLEPHDSDSEDIGQREDAEEPHNDSNCKENGIDNNDKETFPAKNSSDKVYALKESVEAQNSDHVHEEKPNAQKTLTVIIKPKSLVPPIYVYDFVAKRYVIVKDNSTPDTLREENQSAVKEPCENNDSNGGSKRKEEQEIVDLLRRNHRKYGDGSHDPRHVMRSLPLQSDLEKYMWWLQADKHRSGKFTHSMNRYVPGFFKIYKDVPKPGAKTTGSRLTMQGSQHPRSAPPLIQQVPSTPQPQAAFMTETPPIAEESL